MNQKASSVGSIAVRMLSRGGSGEVTRVFQRSAYVRVGDNFLLLLWGRLRSPMTINVKGTYGAERWIAVGEKCRLRKDAVELGGGIVDVRGAGLFRSSLLRSRKVTLPGGSALERGVTMLRSLYDVSLSGTTLAADPALKSFVRRTLSPLALGDTQAVYPPTRYIPLIGRGGGFTPAGDDFVGGLVATFNYVARCRKTRQIQIPSVMMQGRTVPESAAILTNSAKGHVDEGLERLVLATTVGTAGFSDELLDVARRGHTSGIDLSLGVLLCEAALAESEGERRALSRCLDALWHT